MAKAERKKTIWPVAASADGIKLGAFPSSDPDKLQAVMRDLGDYLGEKTGQPVEVVFPEPCRPTIMITAGGVVARLMS